MDMLLKMLKKEIDKLLNRFIKILKEMKDNSIVPSYEASKFIPRAKVLSKKL